MSTIRITPELEIEDDGQTAIAVDLETGPVQVLEGEKTLAAENLSPYVRAVASRYLPDEARAYVTFSICRAFPSVIGPEMLYGDMLGFHPAVLARSAQSLVHQQVNLRHQLVAYKTAKKDRIVGAVVDVAFPMEPEEGWRIPATAEEAPSMTVTTVIHKLAQGATTMLAEHTKGTRKWSVSIEPVANNHELGVWDPGTRELYPLLDLPEPMAAARVVGKRKEGGLALGKYQGRQLVWAMGGINHTVRFQGVGMTPNPAEKNAKILQLHAQRAEEPDGIVTPGYMRFAAEAAPQWLPGQEYTWPRMNLSDVGRGEIIAVHTAGRHGVCRLCASPEAPVLAVKPFGKKEVVFRRAS